MGGQRRTLINSRTIQVVHLVVKVVVHFLHPHIFFSKYWFYYYYYSSVVVLHLHLLTYFLIDVIILLPTHLPSYPIHPPYLLPYFIHKRTYVVNEAVISKLIIMYLNVMFFFFLIIIFSNNY